MIDLKEPDLESHDCFGHGTMSVDRSSEDYLNSITNDCTNELVKLASSGVFDHLREDLKESETKKAKQRIYDRYIDKLLRFNATVQSNSNSSKREYERKKYPLRTSGSVLDQTHFSNEYLAATTLLSNSKLDAISELRKAAETDRRDFLFILGDLLVNSKNQISRSDMVTIKNILSDCENNLGLTELKQKAAAYDLALMKGETYLENLRSYSDNSIKNAESEIRQKKYNFIVKD